MKKIILFAAAVLCAGAVSAQDLKTATELFNNGAEQLNLGDKAAAVSKFKEALAEASALGEEGEEIALKCKEIISNTVLSQAKDLIKEGQYEASVAKLEEAGSAAQEYGVDEVAVEARNLIPQIYSRIAKEAFKAKDVDKAAEYAGKLIDINPDDADAYIILAQSKAAKGDVEAAKEAYLNAQANGKDVSKQLSNLMVKKGQSLIKAGKAADGIAALEEANSYLPNANAYYILGQTYSKQGKNAQAIDNYVKFLDQAPKDKKAGAVSFTLGALYQGQGNKAKAVEYYSKAASDPQYGAEARKYIDQLSK